MEKFFPQHRIKVWNSPSQDVARWPLDQTGLDNFVKVAIWSGWLDRTVHGQTPCGPLAFGMAPFFPKEKWHCQLLREGEGEKRQQGRPSYLACVASWKHPAGTPMN